jgi:hypothetical protein
MFVIEHDTILAPVLAASSQLDSGTAQGMKWMGDLDRYGRATVITTSSC